jgi:NADH dehydrogenase
LGRNVVFPGVINANASTVFDWSLGSAGLTEKMATEAGIDTLTGSSEVLDKYPMMDGVSPIYTKLVFDRNSSRLIGGSVLHKGHGAAQRVDFISFAIQMKATLQDLQFYQYATHPELAAKPSDNTYAFAAKDAAGRRFESKDMK